MVEVGPQRVLGSLVWHVDGDYLYQFIPQISDYLWLQYTETNELSVQWVTRTIKHNYINIIFLRTSPPALSHHSEHISLAGQEGTDQYRGGTRRWQQVHLMWSSQIQKKKAATSSVPISPYLVSLTCWPCCKQTISGWSGGRSEVTCSPVVGFT